MWRAYTKPTCQARFTNLTLWPKHSVSYSLLISPPAFLLHPKKRRLLQQQKLKPDQLYDPHS